MLCSRILRPNGPLKTISGLYTRQMSMWDKSFQDSLKHKDDIMQAKVSGEYKKKVLLPVKAAPSSASCSMFFDQELNAFMNVMLEDGKSYIASEVMREVFESIKEIQLKKFYKATPERRENMITDPTEILKKAVENARPLMALENVKVGGITYTVPAPISDRRSKFEARRWIIKAARDRDRRATRIAPVLANIIVDTFNNSGRVITVRNEHHKTCEQNRAYAHYRLTS